MKLEKYQEYLQAFNRRDYDKVCEFFTPDVVLYTVGHSIRGEKEIRDFYRFFHDYVSERIELTKFVSDDKHLFAEGLMSLEGKKHLSRSKLEQEGYHRFVEVPEGMQVKVPLFLHYDLEGGRFKEIRCANYIPPDE